MFNFEQAITNWKHQMTAGGIKEPTVLDELESHLREEIERQLQAGATEERAFATATKKIGPATTLKNEFRKNGHSSAPDKLLVAFGLFALASIIVLSAVTIFFCYDTSTQRVIGFLGLGFILLPTLGWPRIVPFLPAIQDKAKRYAAQIACLLAGIALGTVYFQIIVRHFGHSDGSLPAIGIWSVIPVAAGFGLACGLECATRRSMTRIKA